MIGREIAATIDSTDLAESRGITVYLPAGFRRSESLPVVFCADGQMVSVLSEALDPEIAMSRVPRTVLIGVNSHATLRNEEYLPGTDRERFEAHRRFFVDEVTAWAEKELGVTDQPIQRAIFGVSNGAAFAVYAGSRTANVYGAVIAYSVPRTPDADLVRRETPPSQRFYLASGNRGAEKLFGKTTRFLANELKRRGHDCCYVQRPGDHAFDLWASLFPDAVCWVFGGP